MHKYDFCNILFRRFTYRGSVWSMVRYVHGGKIYVWIGRAVTLGKHKPVNDKSPTLDQAPRQFQAYSGSLNNLRSYWEPELGAVV